MNRILHQIEIHLNIIKIFIFLILNIILHFMWHLFLHLILKLILSLMFLLITVSRLFTEFIILCKWINNLTFYILNCLCFKLRLSLINLEWYFKTMIINLIHWVRRMLLILIDWYQDWEKGRSNLIFLFSLYLSHCFLFLHARSR